MIRAPGKALDRLYQPKGSALRNEGASEAIRVKILDMKRSATGLIGAVDASKIVRAGNTCRSFLLKITVLK